MSPRAIECFRVTAIEGPEHRGLLDQFHDFLLSLEFDPGEPYQVELGKVAVRFNDNTFPSLTNGIHLPAEHEQAANARVEYYVTEKMKIVLSVPGSSTVHVFTPTQEEANELSQVDPARVNVGSWKDVVHSAAYGKSVFVSCGQQSGEELSLGTHIVEAVKRNTGLDGYFAEYQQSLDGVTRNIFHAIYISAAFIAVTNSAKTLQNFGARSGSNKKSLSRRSLYRPLDIPFPRGSIFNEALGGRVSVVSSSSILSNSRPATMF